MALILFLTIIFLFVCIGNVVDDFIFKKKKNYFIIGALTFFAIFQVWSYIPEIIGLNFAVYSIFTLFIIFIIFIICLMLKGKEIISNSISYLLSKEFLFICAVAIIFSIVIYFWGVCASDSWLYMSLMVKNIELNQLGQLHTSHIFDSYYNFNSFITSFSSADYYTFINTVIIFFQSLLLISSFYFICSSIKIKHKYLIVSLMVISIIGSFTLLLPYFTGVDISYNVFNAGVNGTILLYTITVPLFFIFFTDKNRNYIWGIILLLSGLSFSMSTIYLSLIFALVSSVYFKFFEKGDTYNLSKSIVSILCISTSEFILLYFYMNNYNDIVLQLAIFIVLAVISILVIKYMRFHKLFINLTAIGTLVLVSLCFMTYFFNGNGFINQLYELLNTNIDSYNEYFVNYGYYYLKNYLFNLPILIFYIFSIIVAWKKGYKSLIVFSILCIILFANFVMFATFGTKIGTDVYHRVFQISSLFIYGIILFDYLMSKSRYLTKFILFLFVTVVSMYTMLIPDLTFEHHVYDFSQPFKEFKMYNTDAYELSQYNFPENSTLYTGDLNVASPSVNIVFQVCSNVKISVELTENDYYLVPKEAQKTSNDYIFETENYYLYPPQNLE